MNFKFIRPVYFQDTIECRVTITKISNECRAEAEAVFTNQDGQEVGKAWMSGRLPLEKEKQILADMVMEGDPANKLSDTVYPLMQDR